MSYLEDSQRNDDSDDPGLDMEFFLQIPPLEAPEVMNIESNTLDVLDLRPASATNPSALSELPILGLSREPGRDSAGPLSSLRYSF